MELVRYYLGEEAVEYIRSLWEEGVSLERQLASVLLNRVDLYQGKIYAYLPPGLDDDSLKDFTSIVFPTPDDVPIIMDERGIIVPKSSAGRMHLASFVRDYLLATPMPIALFEEWLSEYHPENRVEEVRRLVIGREICFYLIWKDTDEALIQKTIGKVITSYPPLVGVLSYLKEEEASEWDRTERTGCRADLEKIVANARFLITGAYDGEGYLIWERLGGSLALQSY